MMIKDVPHYHVFTHIASKMQTYKPYHVRVNDPTFISLFPGALCISVQHMFHKWDICGWILRLCVCKSIINIVI